MTTTKIDWMYHGTRNGEGGLVIDSEENPEAVARFLVELKRKKLKLPHNTKIYLWSGTEYFEFQKFNSEFTLQQRHRGIKRLVFTAECKHDGLVKFIWKRHRPESEKRSGRKIVDSIALQKP